MFFRDSFIICIVHSRFVPKEIRFYKAVADATVKYGFNNLTTKRIATEGSCSEALLYRYFDGENDLLKKSFDYYVGILMDEYERKAAESVDLDPEDIVCREWDILFDTFMSIGPAFIFVVEYANSLEYKGDSLYNAFSERINSYPNGSMICQKVHQELPSENSFEVNEQIFAMAFHVVEYAAKQTLTRHEDDVGYSVDNMKQLTLRGFFDVWKKM